MENKLKWFREAKFGLFIHFGLYAVLGGEYHGVQTNWNAEWIMNTLDIPVEEYRKLALQFDPAEFDAGETVKKARSWGMNYIVFTAKHHDGFALYDSACSDYSSVKASPCHRDFVRELALACEKYEMKFGLYYSQSQDWDDPDGLSYRKDNSGKVFQKYLDEKCMPQLRELLTNYGKLSVFWFDTPLDLTMEQSRAMAELVRELQPDCLINGRIGHGLGDYVTTGDENIPRLPYDRTWEVPATTNSTWGYSKFANQWKSAKEIIRLMVKINSRGGNYLLNVGPDALGRIPEKAEEILSEVGAYVSENREAIEGTCSMPYYPYEPVWGEFTCKPHRLYVHIFKPKKIVELLNMKAAIEDVYLVKTGQRLQYSSIKGTGDHWMLQFILPEEMYEEAYYCVCIQIKEEFPIMEAISL